MLFIFQELYSHIDKNSREKFKDMFLVKTANKSANEVGFLLLNLKIAINCL